MIYLYENSGGFILFSNYDGKLEKLNQYSFKNNDEAVDSYKLMSNNELPQNLKIFLIENLEGKSDILAVRDEKLSILINSITKIQTKYVFDEAFKQIRDMEKDQNILRDLFLSHKLCLDKIQMDSNKIDTMIIQSINLLVDLDKDINLHVMRIREWYGLHFPELSLMCDDNLEFLRYVVAIKRKEDCKLEDCLAVSSDEDKANKVFAKTKNSMGAELSDLDLQNILNDSESIIKNFEFRDKLLVYIKNKMNLIAPNISNLVGDIIGARLISKAGSLSALSKYPSSTVQLLGAEKSLFKALKRQTNTPKYGIIFDSSILGQVQLKFKGKIARSLASKISLCAKVDYLNSNEDGSFGNLMKEKLLKRIKNVENKSKSKKKIQTKGKLNIAKLEKYDTSEDVKRVKQEE
ncbi:nucleolar protein NOP5-2 [Nosema bombycis CQ1]|uniref:Nucleolar protein 58 n=1 Tax=Nosema bombycis (strain CQ1 / CVCC 102059) TaxID=578461 RepID=R0KPA0_NOSB1|nr:nucleolar protein NOP5-2 [Nosema bombycis CQ1]|eukprot:EOB12012.1 nucleolar protein NOP5-2 [Nosema bombycis CQ1]